MNASLYSEPPTFQIKRRGHRPLWRRYYALARAYCYFLPVTKTWELLDRWPRFLSEKMAQYWGTWTHSYAPDEHDVLVCSYFKSGTNWTMQIVVQIAHRGRASFEHIHDLVPWPDLSLIEEYAARLEDDSTWRNTPTGMRAIKTHRPLQHVPYSDKARYICVVRDPKDVCVSGYHFLRKSYLGPLMPSMSSWLKTFLSPHALWGSWAEHLQSYWEIRHRQNVLFLTYEEMVADLPTTVRRIADFMGVDLTAEEFDAVVRNSSFSHMKAIRNKFGSVGPIPFWISTADEAMIRRGQRGAASELLSSAQQRRIDDYWRSELVRLGCDFPYDRAFGSRDARSNGA